MMTLTLNYWLLIYGALAGFGAALAARGGNRLVKAAVVGAIIVFVVDVVRGLL
ncbi:hypothetical protein [Yoonia sp.]|uniref:hypothetical protein n=1 Tax=Yoonia sp. TaxID=2212373 RepID=UPI0019F3F82E|nr:hypothetical protein [Yoonia sp.]MBE0413184.1 hypothetical protein [Yoonia sp.]